MFKKQLLLSFLVFYSCTLFANATIAPTPSNIDFSQFPAITIQGHFTGTAKSKLATLTSQANAGIWIALDTQTNTLYYKITHDDQQIITPIQLKKISDATQKFIQEYKGKILDHFEDLIDKQELARLEDAIREHFKNITWPNTPDYLTYAYKNFDFDHEAIYYGGTYAQVDLFKKIAENSIRYEQNIAIWQTKYHISEENIKELNQLYQAVKKHINDHQNSMENAINPLSFSITTPIQKESSVITADPQIVHILEFSHISVKNFNGFSSSRIDCKGNILFYFPANPIQYGNAALFEPIGAKIASLNKYLKEKGLKSPLRADAAEQLKARANEITTTLVTEIKKLQDEFATEIDQVCEKLKNIF